jgi:hypothetical protein
MVSTSPIPATKPAHILKPENAKVLFLPSLLNLDGSSSEPDFSQKIVLAGVIC